MWSLTVPFAYEPVGPKAFPVLLAVLMAVCCILLIINPANDIHWPELPVLRKGAALLAVLLAYGYFFEILGYPVASVFMVLVVSRLFGGGWLSSSLSAISIGVFGYLIFDRMLEVSLPLGRVWG
jgi:putative tricarboxylic transport membrane protein